MYERYLSICLLLFWVIFQGFAQPDSKAPYSPSDHISGIHFDPDSTIIRMAEGGDNWPLTWAADDNLYTTYGDGFGFEPKITEKLGLGFARVEGTPPDVKGINIRSASENQGYGRNGKKGTGILALNDRIFIWLMHADEKGGQAQLAWSDNYLKELKSCDWKFSEFGICSFINYGKNNANARDQYIYSVSHDGPRADNPADQFILMRVKQKNLLKRKAYRFFNGINEKGKPTWTKEIAKRSPVFSNQGQCLRSSISYNAGLKRYLWWQQIPNFKEAKKDFGDTRFEGGFGIYEAPEPWGPWHTVFYTEDWDVGPGELASFPPKWISQDGKTGYLVFSGDDAFSIRKLTFELADGNF